MAIFDIINEVNEKNITKTETGEPRIFGVLIGEVTNNYSMEMPGRVCVSIHVRDSEANVLKWARVAMPSSGTEWGHYFLPEVGDQVLVIFDQGIIDKPYIIGCIPKDKNKFLRECRNETNSYKMIRTKNGSTIKFTDTTDGSLDKIEVYTPDSMHKLVMDNANRKIFLGDNEDNASISMNTLTGSIDVKTVKSFEIKVGELITMTLNGLTGNITMKCAGLDVDASGPTGGISLKSTKDVKLNGTKVSIKGQASCDVEAIGTLKLEGKPVKMS